MNINITWQHLDKSEVLDDYFRHKVEHLEHYDNPIISAELSLQHDAHHRKGDIYSAEARLVLPNKKVFAKEQAEHPNEAIDLLIETLRIQLTKHSQKSESQDTGKRSLRDKLRLKRIKR
ncbi:MAG: ribosome-associated translation inhibitor RaiA [bacterium]|nr:ribosome-associated translation inhibitor RaiA [bacterium]